jgi:hypothetical protein
MDLVEYKMLGTAPTTSFLRMKFTKCRRSFGIDCRAMVCYLRGGKELDGFFWPDDNA